MQVSKRIRTLQEKRRIVLDNILLATDSSDSSKVALRYALELARHYDAKIYIVRGVPMDSVQSLANDARQETQDEARSFADRYTKELRLSGMLDGVRHAVLVGEEGDKVLPTLLETLEFDLAVNGVANCEGETILLEPTIEEVIRRSQCPVLNVGSRFHSRANGEMKHILFATDFSLESLEASRYALSLAQEFQTRLTLLHVVEGFEPKLLDKKALIAKPYELWLGKLVPDEAQLWCELDLVVEFGRPGERILQVAWENHAHLIVVGARGLERLTAPGLNVRKLMCNAWCPVLTVSGALDNWNQERFWRAAAAASESQNREMVMQEI